MPTAPTEGMAAADVAGMLSNIENIGSDDLACVLGSTPIAAKGVSSIMAVFVVRQHNKISYAAVLQQTWP